MKKIIPIVALILTISLIPKAQTVFSQNSDYRLVNLQANGTVPGNSIALTGYTINSDSSDEPIKDHAFYIHKNKSQKILGFVLLGGGATLLAVAAKGNTSLDGLGALVVVGALTTLSSIPLFISSAKNKRRSVFAMTKQKTAFGIPGKVSKNITGITMSIPIGK